MRTSALLTLLFLCLPAGILLLTPCQCQEHYQQCKEHGYGMSSHDILLLYIFTSNAYASICVSNIQQILKIVKYLTAIQTHF